MTSNYKISRSDTSNLKESIQMVKKLKKKNSSIDGFYQNLQKDKLDEKVINELTIFKVKYNKLVSKTAKIFMEKFESKYNDRMYRMPLSTFLTLLLKYKKKYNLTDEEFNEAKKIFEKKMFNYYKSDDDNKNDFGSKLLGVNTRMSRTLGNIVTMLVEPLKINESKDMKYVQEIEILNGQYKQLHSYLQIQTLLYKGMSEWLATTGSTVVTRDFDPLRMNINLNVSYLLAALFLPKIKSLEERMIYSSFSNIVISKYLKQPIISSADHKLLYSVVTDPFDLVCVEQNEPVLKDLLYRTHIQTQLWINIFNLRSAKIFDLGNDGFNNFINKCKITNLDNPDLNVLGDEGIMLRRLFNVFSFKPLLVQTVPLNPILVNNPALITNPLNLQTPVKTITSFPYIIYRLNQINPMGRNDGLTNPLTGPIAPVLNMQTPNQKEYLQSVLNDKQVHLVFENGGFVPNLTRILHFDQGPLIIYVPRRVINLPFGLQYPQITPPQILPIYPPTNIYPSGFTQILKSPVYYKEGVKVTSIYDSDINNQNAGTYFKLKSVLAYKTLSNDPNDPNSNILSGFETYFFSYIDITKTDGFEDTKQQLIEQKKYLEAKIVENPELVLFVNDRFLNPSLSLRYNAKSDILANKKIFTPIDLYNVDDMNDAESGNGVINRIKDPEFQDLNTHNKEQVDHYKNQSIYKSEVDLNLFFVQAKLSILGSIFVYDKPDKNDYLIKGKIKLNEETNEEQYGNLSTAGYFHDHDGFYSLDSDNDVYVLKDEISDKKSDVRVQNIKKIMTSSLEKLRVDKQEELQAKMAPPGTGYQASMWGHHRPPTTEWGWGPMVPKSPGSMTSVELARHMLILAEQQRAIEEEYKAAESQMELVRGAEAAAAAEEEARHADAGPGREGAAGQRGRSEARPPRTRISGPVGSSP